VKKDAGIEDEGEDEAEPVDEEDEDGEAKPVKETIFLAGRLYREDTWVKVSQTTLEQTIESDGKIKSAREPEMQLTTKWIYERWNKVVTNEKFPDVAKTMSMLMQKSS